MREDAVDRQFQGLNDQRGDMEDMEFFRRSSAIENCELMVRLAQVPCAHQS